MCDEWQVVEYIFVTGHPSKVESVVNDKIHEGYAPIGGPLIAQTLVDQWGRTKTEVVYQAMVKRGRA